MKIKTVRFARVYKKEGVTLLLRIDYPLVEGEGIGILRINSLYEKLVEIIGSYAERLVGNMRPSVYTLCHACEASVNAETDTLSVRRFLKLKCGARTILLGEECECLSLSEGIDKGHKNVKKQRNIPLRKKKTGTKAKN